MLEQVRDKLKSDLTWQEKVQIVLDYHAYKLDSDPRHTLAMTAKELNVSEATVSFDLRLAKFLRANPDKTNTFQSKTKAIQVLFSKINYPRIEVRGNNVRGRLIRSLFLEEKEYSLIKLDKPVGNAMLIEYIVYPTEACKVRYDND